MSRSTNLPSKNQKPKGLGALTSQGSLGPPPPPKAGCPPAPPPPCIVATSQCHQLFSCHFFLLVLQQGNGTQLRCQTGSSSTTFIPLLPPRSQADRHRPSMFDLAPQKVPDKKIQKMTSKAFTMLIDVWQPEKCQKQSCQLCLVSRICKS